MICDVCKKERRTCDTYRAMENFTFGLSFTSCVNLDPKYRYLGEGDIITEGVQYELGGNTWFRASATIGAKYSHHSYGRMRIKIEDEPKDEPVSVVFYDMEHGLLSHVNREEFGKVIKAISDGKPLPRIATSEEYLAREAENQKASDQAYLKGRAFHPFVLNKIEEKAAESISERIKAEVLKLGGDGILGGFGIEGIANLKQEDVIAHLHDRISGLEYVADQQVKKLTVFRKKNRKLKCENKAARKALERVCEYLLSDISRINNESRLILDSMDELFSKNGKSDKHIG